MKPISKYNPTVNLKISTRGKIWALKLEKAKKIVKGTTIKVEIAEGVKDIHKKIFILRIV